LERGVVGLHLPVEQLERPFEGALGVCVVALALATMQKVVGMTLAG
jgi:hypothetical protein